jgi:hypothetical protein
VTTDRARWAAGALGAALLLAGCGALSSSTGGSPATTAAGTPSANPVLTAYRNTVAAKTASMSLTEDVTGSPSGPISITGTGQVDLATGDASLSLAIPPVGSLSILLVKPVVYLQLPASLGVSLPAGKSWVSIDLNSPAVSSALGSSYAQLSNSADLSTQELSYLQAVGAGGVTTVGPAIVRGVPTTEYAATIDVGSLGNQGNAAVRAALQKLGNSLHLSSIPIHVWIDGQGQVRQEDLTVAATSGSTAVSADVTVQYYDFGAPVDLVAPPAGQVVDFSSISGAPSGA